MPNPSCPLPGPLEASEDQAIPAMLAMRRIAVVGASNDESRAGNYVVAYLMEHGYEVTPVNPMHPSVLGRLSYRTLAEAPGPLEMVLVFRRPEFCADVARQAVAAGATGIWLQSGIISAEARAVAKEAGIWFVEDRCAMVEVRKNEKLE